jgi:four helix bundle protein
MCSRSFQYRVMVAKRLEDLVAWQLASKLRDDVVALTAGRTFNRDWRLRNQLRDAGSSVVANVAEGFGRFRPREFARFLRTANGSVHEVRTHLDDAVGREYVCLESVADLRKLCQRTSIAMTRLIRYLDRCDPNGPTASRSG